MKHRILGNPEAVGETNPNATEGYTAAGKLPGGCENCRGVGAVPYKYAWCDWTFDTCPICNGTGDPP